MVGAGAFIKAGEYSIESSRGLVPGEYQVQVSSLGEEEIRAMSKRLPDGSFPNFQESIPARYNLRSTLVVKLTDAREQRFDFDLELSPDTGH